MRRLPLALVVSALLAGCGGSGGGESSATATPDEGAAFPVTVEHRYGETTVEQEPQRVVVVGLTEQDILYELGVSPVGVTEWYGDQPNATWPWAREAAARIGARPEVLETTDGFDYEAIAALRPDLIIGTNAGIEREDYEQLTELAPTVAGTVGGTDYFSPWDEQTELVAASVGKADEGRRIVEEVKGAYAAAAAEHPDFAGKTATFSQGGFSDGALYVYPDGLGTQFLTMLGFEMNPRIAPRTEPGLQAQIPEEQADLIDADALVFATETPESIEGLFRVPTFSRVDGVAEDRAVFTGPTLAGAIYFMTPLSLRYVLERLPDPLQRAVDGEAPREPISSQ